MTLPSWREEPIGKHHDRAAFACGDVELDSFLQRYARQSHEAGGAKTFVAADNSDHRRVLGFYSVAPATLMYEQTPHIVRRKLARHEVPGFRLARLATDIRVQGQGLGGSLLAAAARRCIRAAAEVGGVMMVIDAKNERAAAWYAAFGALPLDDAPGTLVIALATFETSLREAGRL